MDDGSVVRWPTGQGQAIAPTMLRVGRYIVFLLLSGYHPWSLFPILSELAWTATQFSDRFPSMQLDAPLQELFPCLRVAFVEVFKYTSW